MTLDSAQIRRLAFIKFLYRHGLQLLRQPEPLACASLLLFHDAAELFLELACEVQNVTRPKDKQKDFMAYWDALNDKLAPATVSEKAGMSTLNKARASLKHHGHMHNRLSLDSFANTLNRFFNDNTKTLFQVSFVEISLIDLVFPESAQTELKEAENALALNNRTKAASHIALAFHKTIDDFETRRRDRFGRNPFFFGESLNFVVGNSLIDHSQPAHMGSNRGINSGSQIDIAKLRRTIDSIGSTVQDLQSALGIIALGIDFRKYSRFRYLTPAAWHNISGECFVEDLPEDHGNALNHEELTFCIDFVIETSLLLQESDYPTGAGTTLPNESP